MSDLKKMWSNYKGSAIIVMVLGVILGVYLYIKGFIPVSLTSIIPQSNQQKSAGAKWKI